jgi:hypothetical protein
MIALGGEGTTIEEDQQAVCMFPGGICKPGIL